MTTTPRDIPNTWDGIEMAARIAGAKFPQVVAAQWALESGWGRRESGKNNLFGLKGFMGTKRETLEQVGPGKKAPITDTFLDFPSRRAAVEYLVTRWYADFRNFRGVNRAESPAAAAVLLQQEGYATDENYSKLLIKLVQERQQAKAANPTVAAPAAPRLTTIAGMVGPAKSPRDFGMKPNDSHLIVNDRAQTLTAWSGDGKRLFVTPALARGQGRDDQWEQQSTDTPPGLYRLGQVWNDIAIHGENPAIITPTMQSYGWVTIDMVELENQEARYGRAGICIHGGGTALGARGSWAPQQPLVPTLGCVRVRNHVLRDQILPLMKQGTVYISVFQEAKK